MNLQTSDGISMREMLVIPASLLVVGVSTAFAVLAWSLTWILDPLWHASLTTFFWIVGFAVGDRLFWIAVTRIQPEGTSS